MNTADISLALFAFEAHFHLQAETYRLVTRHLDYAYLCCKWREHDVTVRIVSKKASKARACSRI